MRPEIEISLEQFMVPIGATEMLKAVEHGLANPATCFCCRTTLKCVPDAELVISPDYPVMSSSPNIHVQDNDRRRCEFSRLKIGGVGRGLKVKLC